MTREVEVFNLESTGRKFYAYTDLISIGKDLKPHYGCDGDIEVVDSNGNPEYEHECDFEAIIRPEEKKEMALYMIELWKKFGGIE